MDAYLHVISVIKKLGYICDTLLYLIDLQYKLFLRRVSKDRQVTTRKPAQTLSLCGLFYRYSESVAFQFT